MGSDLAAQTARASFFAGHGWTPIDLRWYAGVDQLGYSFVSQPVMAILGVRLTGALSLVLSSVLLAALFRRTGAPRLWLGALVGTACIAFNLVSGRVTYGLGVALGLAALLLLTYPRLRWLAAVAAFAASATSPVAGLFLGLAGVSLLIPRPGRGPLAAAPGQDAPAPSHDAPAPSQDEPAPARNAPAPDTGHPSWHKSGFIRNGLLIAVPAAIPLGLTAFLFGDGGWMNISSNDVLRAVVASLAVAVLVPRWPVRAGALLSAAGVLGASLIHTPVGLNATRLAVMFTLPLIAGYAAVPALPSWRLARWSGRALPVWAVLPLVAVLFWWQPPVEVADVRDIGNPTADPSYFAPLLARLGQERLTGRVEVPPTQDYWEAAYMGNVPLARGWLRQADIERNPLFFTDIPGARGTGVALTADSYRAWLAERAVQFVAVPDAKLHWSGRPEAQLIATGLPYLTPVWSDEHWRLYAVADPQPIVPAPATMVAQTAAGITFDAPAAADLTLRVHYYRWLTASGGASVRPRGEWTLVHVPAAGRYTLSS
ncbi:hypothetical protein [Actinoplanes sp. TBRC 11911]|uniref:hypothetical protein n=1 Tax=Actinoplanes sp. TBRC 11911 TaxID=2729386 RepID=UPI0020071337|nr:hypothetical protein [Actinoplanes sp. TBRC 11911]